MLFAFLLVAASGLPSPAQQQHVAAATYRLFYHAQASGSFVYEFGVGHTLRMEEIDADLAYASAVAVDPDGWLIAVRHGSDPQSLTREFCAGIERRWMRYRVDRVRLDVSVTDIVGNLWAMRYTVSAPPDSGHDVCHASGQLNVERDTVFPARLIALDDLADLALIKIDLQWGPISALSWGSSAALREASLVYGYGFASLEGVTKNGGYLALDCEERLEETERVPHLGPDVVRLRVERMMRLVMHAQPGMSGGPVAFGDSLVGIIVSGGPSEADPSRNIVSVPLTMAVPSDYVRAWYRHVRWPKQWPRPTSVCALASE